MRKLLLAAIVLITTLSCAQSYNINMGGISYTSGTTAPTTCLTNGSWYFYITNSTWYQCVSGTWTAALGGAGSVTVVGGGNLTSTAIVTGGGTQTLQTPSATSTLNSSGNMSLAGTLGVTGHVTLEGVTSTGATGTGLLVFGTSPTFVTPVLGTPASGTLTNATGLPENGLVGAVSAATLTETVGGIITRTGVEVNNLTSPYAFQNTNASNNNTSVGAIIGAAGSSTGGIGLLVYDVSGTGDIQRWYSSGSMAAGVYTVGTLEASLTATGQLNLGGATCTAGTGGGLCATEGTAPTAASSSDQIYADSTNHQFEASQNNFANAASVKFFPIQVNAINTQTASYAMVAQDSAILCNKGTAMTITLLASGIPSGKSVRVKNIGAGACTVTAAAGNIDNQSTVVLPQYTAVDLVWDNSQWWLF